jgi:hypothetical protein
MLPLVEEEAVGEEPRQGLLPLVDESDDDDAKEDAKEGE